MLPPLRLELRVSEVELDTDRTPVRSIVAETRGELADLDMEAAAPLTIAANKLVGLGWRVVKRGRPGPEHDSPDDRNLVRHVHDLATLEPAISQDTEAFADLVARTVESDRPRFSSPDMSAREPIMQATHLLTEEIAYETEYADFVEQMSFARDSERIGYRRAFDAYHRIVGYVFPLR